MSAQELQHRAWDTHFKKLIDVYDDRSVLKT